MKIKENNWKIWLSLLFKDILPTTSCELFKNMFLSILLLIITPTYLLYAIPVLIFNKSYRKNPVDMIPIGGFAFFQFFSGIVTAGLLKGTITASVFISNLYWILPVSMAAIILLIMICVGIMELFSYLNSKFQNKIHKIKVKKKEEKQPSFIKQVIKNIKDKTCTKIEYEK